MSTGFVMCSACRREIHHTGYLDKKGGWFHCEDRSPRCQGGTTEYPRDVLEVVGPWCGRDGKPRDSNTPQAPR